MEKKTAQQKRPPFFRRMDVLVVAALALVGGIWLLVNLATPRGALATVSLVRTDSGETELMQLWLNKDETLHITEGLPFAVTLEVRDGAIRFTNPQCKDHLCAEMGWLSREGEWALCAPAGVMVRIVEDGAGVP